MSASNGGSELYLIFGVASFSTLLIVTLWRMRRKETSIQNQAPESPIAVQSGPALVRCKTSLL